jgi:hypothetical protein
VHVITNDDDIRTLARRIEPLCTLRHNANTYAVIPGRAHDGPKMLRPMLDGVRESLTRD